MWLLCLRYTLAVTADGLFIHSIIQSFIHSFILIALSQQNYYPPNHHVGCAHRSVESTRYRTSYSRCIIPRIRTPPSSGLFLATIYNQSQLKERKHVARYWSISAVPVSAHPSPLVITTKLAATILVVAVVSTDLYILC